jgi:hypothetical protein
MSFNPFTARRCHPKCAFAKGPECTCPCGGLYHGKGAMICEAWNAETEITRSDFAEEIARAARRLPLWQPRLF